MFCMPSMPPHHRGRSIQLLLSLLLKSGNGAFRGVNRYIKRWKHTEFHRCNRTTVQLVVRHTNRLEVLDKEGWEKRPGD